MPEDIGRREGNKVKEVVAFFDLDHTLLDGANGNLYARKMVKEGLMKTSGLFWMVWYTGLYKLNRLPRREVYRRFLEVMGRYTVLEMIEMMDRGFEEDIMPRLYREGVTTVFMHREKGHRTVIATAAGEYVAERVRAQLGADDFIATPFPIEGDRIAGDMEGPTAFMEGKLEMARQYCESRGVDLADCYFYSDSASDLPLLEAVGHPVMVNPQLKLSIAARGRPWPVLRFRGYADFDRARRPERLLTPDMDRLNRIYEATLETSGRARRQAVDGGYEKHP
ncbi:MAG: HAD-IB family hydrolase [Verrucomicrobia bacterium]|nr:HAD-IB family hydrolase [Verrucomicrobiota bacterium]